MYNLRRHLEIGGRVYLQVATVSLGESRDGDILFVFIIPGVDTQVWVGCKRLRLKCGFFFAVDM